MAGHNKWSKIKRQKAVTDARKSKAWARVTREIMVAAREAGGDPGMNARLALAVDRAKAENMPKDNIERAIKRGTGEIEGEDYVEMTYEGYGPHGVAVFVEALTDNTNRTVADLRHIFSKAGGSLGQSGNVAFLFDRKGIIEIEAEGHDELQLFELVVEAGAEDLARENDTFIVTTSVEDFGTVREAIRGADIEPAEAELQRLPTTTVALDPAQARKVAAMIEKLEDHQDVQAVYSTLELDDATIQAIV
ncbi:MAG: YebC/PmpR family DNA-binding transcriptional regulator [Rhodothermales bacterium]|nr:YebC/PmpR family DNA-binding transcriptional regulator [Rhodothermales bacterium]